MVCGWSRYERGGGDQRCGGRRSIDDGAWEEYGGQGGVYGDSSGGADGMRGDGVGIGHVDEVQGRAGGIGDAAGINHFPGSIGDGVRRIFV